MNEIQSQHKGEQQTAPEESEHRANIGPGHQAPNPSVPVVMPPPGQNSEELPASRFSARQRRIAVIVIPLMIIGGLLLGFFPRWHERRTALADMGELSVPTVSVVSLAPLETKDGLVLPAEVRPWREASIYARANGYLKDWVADIGAQVQAGELLAEIETPDLDQQLEQSKAQLALAQANLKLAKTTDVRWQDLLKTASVSEQAAAEKSAGREVAVASVAAAQADVRRLEELVSFQRVIAPFAGTVTRRQVDIGDLIVAGSGGQELFHMAQTGKLRVYVHVPEPYALEVAPGQIATLTTPENTGQVFDAKVITTSESIATASRTLLTELEVDNSNNQILPYSYGEISFKANHANPPMTLPSSVLIFRSMGLQVGVVRPDGTVELRAVKVGRDFGQNIEILGGVERADRIIANPTDSLVDGIKVRVQPATNAIAAN